MYIEYSFRGLLNALFRHYLTIMSIGAVFVLMGLFYVMNIQSVYDSQSTMLVKFGGGAMQELNRESPSEYSNNDRQEIMQSYEKMLFSRDLLLPAVKKIGADKLDPSLIIDLDEENAAQLQAENNMKAVRSLVGGAVVVVIDKKSNTISLRVTNKDPEIAAKFAQTLTEDFIAYQNEIYSASDVSFMQAQIDGSKGLLEEAQRTFLGFKQAVSISDLEKEMQQLHQEKTTISTMAFGVVNSAQQELSGLRAREAEMLVTYQPKSPILRALQDRIAVVEDTLHARQDELMAISEEPEGAVTTKLAKIDERIAYLEKHRSEYDEHANIVQTRETDFQYFKQKGEDARINEALRKMNITRITVLEKPIIAISPVPAKKKLILIAFIMMGAFFGLSIALVIEVLDDRINTSEGAQSAIGLPVIASFDRQVQQPFSKAET